LRREAPAVVQTTVIAFPFDLFGSAGAGPGAQLLAGELREVLADNKRERVPTRACAYAGKVRLREVAFETLAAYEDWRSRGRLLVRQALQRGDFLVWLTGNHLGALPVYDELAAAPGDTLVVQFDAHLDVHNFADCTPEPSHGNFLLHCDGPLPALMNAGHRDLLLTPDYVGRFYRAAFPAAELAVDPTPALDRLRREVEAARRVFFDIDCDVFDPAFFPAVAEPVPFGLGPQQVLRLLDAAWSPKVAGVLLSEFDPGRDRDDRCLETLVWLLEYLLLRRYE
jgi:arginase family enzyme